MKPTTSISENAQLISADMAYHYKIVPFSSNDNFIDFYIEEGKDIVEVGEELELFLGKKVRLTPLAKKEIDKVLSINYRREVTSKNIDVLSINNSDFLEDILYEAKSLKSSDIHFEVYEKTSRIRFRIDGQLVEKYKIEKDNYLELVNKIKINAKLNITEKRLPQDGRITNGTFDIRVSILPTLFGEKIVLRLLSQDASNLNLENLGMDKANRNLYIEAIKKPNGLVLISGPTGSGKTTTLYASLRLLNDNIRNIVTVEDPIEYTLKGINQVQLKEDIGLSFSAALRSFLRQDPDIIMLGEIRDSETALMAIRASLTGHLVLSTIHTNSALGTISRLLDMGVPSYLIAETLNISVAQRLLRCLCDNCKTEIPFEKDNFPENYKLPYAIDKYFVPVGCEKCYYTGYYGRKAIYEVIPMSYNLAKAIRSNNISESFTLSDKEDLPTKAFDLMAEGETSLDEIYPILISI
jgi:type IV pilus assembly protein PilB